MVVGPWIYVFNVMTLPAKPPQDLIRVTKNVKVLPHVLAMSFKGHFKGLLSSPE